IVPGSFAGRNIKYGIREFAMAGIAAGLSQTDVILPYVGTFLTFSDYMRNAIRLAALSHVQVIYQFTHDSIFLGEDGPTHQPVEHLAALRAMPNLHVIRPGDPREVKKAWIAALRYRGPTAIVLSRQALPDIPGTDVPYEEGMALGAYLIKDVKQKPDFSLFATGSELSLAMDVARALEKTGKAVRVISIPCWSLFDSQPESYRRKILQGDFGPGRSVSIEAGVSMGWAKWIGPEGISIAIDTFGASASQSDLAAEFGFTVDAILPRLLS
ncbi:MAG: transketolase, partial [Chlamydiae bacterium]|nr:transketolase [Chlamydiota bacterium]